MDVNHGFTEIITSAMLETITEIIRESRDDLDSLRSVLNEFCRYTGAAAVLRDISGEIISEIGGGGDFFKNAPSSECRQVMINIEYGDYKALAFPLVTAFKPVGTLFFCRGTDFTPQEIDGARICVIVASLKLARLKDEEAGKKALKLRTVRAAIGTLSYTELIAVTRVFDDFQHDGLIVASRIAEKFSITRSVIVSALRKLESAGIIEVRSLGMKGTHIKVKNDLFIRELKKLKG